MFTYILLRRSVCVVWLADVIERRPIINFKKQNETPPPAVPLEPFVNKKGIMGWHTLKKGRRQKWRKSRSSNSRSSAI